MNFTTNLIGLLLLGLYSLLFLKLEARTVHIHHNPYQASIHLGKTEGQTCVSNTTKYVCSGALISFQTVITAASCFFKTSTVPPESYYVRAGTHYWRESGIFTQVKAIVYHDGLPINSWETLPFNDYVDLALVMVIRPFPEKKSIAPLKLPAKDDAVPVGDTYSFTTWAKAQLSVCPCKFESSPEAEKYGNYLKEYDITTLPAEDCSFYSRKRPYHAPKGITHEYQICADNGMQHGVCAFDGGILAANNTIYGVYTYNPDVMCNVLQPGVFTRVSPSVDWLRLHIDIADVYESDKKEKAFCK